MKRRIGNHSVEMVVGNENKPICKSLSLYVDNPKSINKSILQKSTPNTLSTSDIAVSGKY